MSNMKWLETEHNLRFMLSEVGLTEFDEIKIDELKDSIIALLGIKLMLDDNEVFKSNMIAEAKESIQHLRDNTQISKSRLNTIEKFINENLV